jgi:tetratricopeptide (TPR) repeat protein
MCGRSLAAAILVVTAASAIARAQSDGGVEESPSAESVLKRARDDFEFGNYERVVTRLRPLVEALELSRELPDKADRAEALRVYGIACTLTGRRTAAEGAFLLLLREEPSTRLDPALVRPEAVAFFDEVRARHHAELLQAYRKNRRPYHWALDLIPLAGQLQNRQWKKAIVLGSIDLFLLAANVTTGALLGRYEGDTHSFDGHRGAFEPLRDVNWISFGLLLSVTAGGIVDAFVVGARRSDRDRQTEARLGF